jgi:hypothetical protein
VTSVIATSGACALRSLIKMKERYKVTTLDSEGNVGNVYWVDLGDSAILNCFGGDSIKIEREIPHETFTAHYAIRTIIPRVDYINVSLGELADFIRHHCAVIRPPGINVVIIPQELEYRYVNYLRMIDAPLASMLSYVAEITDTEVTYEPDAIVIRDKK